MYDELTAIDIKKMQEEIDYRVNVLRPQCLEDVKTARGFGDLSENFEYKAAKLEKNRNDSRIRYLERMIKTAEVITVEPKAGEVDMFDSVEIFFEEDEVTQTIRITTTLRQDALRGIISPLSPLGKSLMGHKVGDCICVAVNSDYRYHVVIRAIEKGQDDESLPISLY